MTVYELMDSVLYCETIEKGMENLKTLVTILDKERYTSKLLDNFYERINYVLIRLYNIFSYNSENSERYRIEKGSSALHLYIALTIPKRKKPKQTLKLLQDYANEQLTSLKDGKKNLVYEDMIKNIMQYMDETYQFSENVFKGERIVPFLILDMKHIKYSGECSGTKTQEEQENLDLSFFFYLSSDEVNINNVVEEVFFALSYAIIAQYSGNIGQLSDNLV